MELGFYIGQNAIGLARTKQTGAEWQLWAGNYRDTRNEYAKTTTDFLEAFTRDLIRPSSSCASYLTKLTEKCSKEMSEADSWALIYFNSLGPAEERQTGKVEEEEVWSFKTQSLPSEMESAPGNWLTITLTKDEQKQVDYGDAKYSLSNWNNFERTYKQAHCTLKKLMNYIQGLNIGEGNVKFITPPFAGTTTFAPPYEAEEA
tara:strand:+ start:94 stop:702 length:609 start_codon:yes stop_codon:yes gene_type:complete